MGVSFGVLLTLDLSTLGLVLVCFALRLDIVKSGCFHRVLIQECDSELRRSDDTSVVKKVDREETWVSIETCGFHDVVNLFKKERSISLSPSK